MHFESVTVLQNHGYDFTEQEGEILTPAWRHINFDHPIHLCQYYMQF